MSIRSLALICLAPACVLAPACEASAQSGDSETAPSDVVGPLLERLEEAYSLPEPEPERPADCVLSDDTTVIVVCAPVEGDPEQYRVASRLEKGDDSHLSWSGEAPNVAGPGIFTGPATVSGLCVIPPCPPPPVYMIDVTALPEAPPGSDADRIARGLAPRGSRYDDGEAQVVAGEKPADPVPAEGEPDRPPP